MLKRLYGKQKKQWNVKKSFWMWTIMMTVRLCRQSIGKEAGFLMGKTSAVTGSWTVLTAEYSLKRRMKKQSGTNGSENGVCTQVYFCRSERTGTRCAEV